LGGVELILSYQKTELVPEARRVAIARPVRTVVPVGMRRGYDRLGWSSERPQLFDRTEADSVRLAQCAIHGASFGHPHFGAPHQRRNVRRIGVAVTDKPLRETALIHGSFEDPTTGREIGEPVL